MSGAAGATAELVAGAGARSLGDLLLDLETPDSVLLRKGCWSRLAWSWSEGTACTQWRLAVRLL